MNVLAKSRNLTHLKSVIAAIVGTSNISNSTSELSKNTTDKSGIKSALATLAVYPRNKNQVVETIKLANRNNLQIVPRGGGSGLCGGALAGGSIAMNLSRMARVISVDKKSKSARVEGGTILDSLNKAAGKKGLFFPVQPASHKIATIGGMVSTNAGGEHVLKFGRVADNIIELEVVTGNGQLLTVRGNKIKHFSGTEGINGIIVEAKLKLLPQIKEKSILTMELEDESQLILAVKNAMKNKNLISCEFMDPEVYKMAGFRKKYFLLLEYMDKKSGKITKKEKMHDAWKVREGCFKLLDKKGWKIISDPKITLETAGKFLLWCRTNGLPSFGHIGHGVIHVHAKTRQKMASMYAMLGKVHGEVSGEHGFGIMKKKYLPKARKKELKKLKRLYDKNNVLNKGKVI